MYELTLAPMLSLDLHLEPHLNKSKQVTSAVTPAVSTTASYVLLSTGTYINLNLVLWNQNREVNNSYQTALPFKNSLVLVMVMNIFKGDNSTLRIIKIEDSPLNNQNLVESKIEYDES